MGLDVFRRPSYFTECPRKNPRSTATTPPSVTDCDALLLPFALAMEQWMKSYFHTMKELVTIWALVFLFTSLRYVVFASAVYFPVYRWLRERVSAKKIQAQFPKKKDYRREVAYSFSTFCVFGFTGTLIHLVRDHTQIYDDLASYPLWWSALSIPLALVIHDTYFYWTHRLMHHPRLFKTMHLVHHRSTNPSPWASFAFHPLEAVVESGILIVLVFLMPMHPLAILAFLLVMTGENVVGHLGYEFFPAWLTRSPIGRWLNSSTNHNMHHKYFEGNYGLYFRWWDVWMGTTHPKYEETLAEVQQRVSSPSAQQEPHLEPQQSSI